MSRRLFVIGAADESQKEPIDTLKRSTEATAAEEELYTKVAPNRHEVYINEG